MKMFKTQNKENVMKMSKKLLAMLCAGSLFIAGSVNAKGSVDEDDEDEVKTEVKKKTTTKKKGDTKPEAKKALSLTDKALAVVSAGGEVLIAAAPLAISIKTSQATMAKMKEAAIASFKAMDLSPEQFADIQSALEVANDGLKEGLAPIDDTIKLFEVLNDKLISIASPSAGAKVANSIKGLKALSVRMENYVSSIGDSLVASEAEVEDLGQAIEVAEKAAADEDEKAQEAAEKRMAALKAKIDEAAAKKKAAAEKAKTDAAAQAKADAEAQAKADAAAKAKAKAVAAQTSASKLVTTPTPAPVAAPAARGGRGR